VRVPSAVRWLLTAGACPPYAPLRAGTTQRAEVLEAMRREGLLVHVVGGVYLPADVAGSALARATALAQLVPAGGVVGMVTAAWLRGAPVGPEPVDVLVPHAAGPRPVVAGVREHRTTIPRGDVTTLAGLRLTTLARTAADLARCDDERALPALRWLLDGAVTEWQVLTVLRTNQRFRHNRRARAVLRGLRAERSPAGRAGVP
jgi:hypothetical protein